jgi:DNA-binding NarL/FixJ family response regulator
MDYVTKSETEYPTFALFVPVNEALKSEPPLGTPAQRPLRVLLMHDYPEALIHLSEAFRAAGLDIAMEKQKGAGSGWCSLESFAPDAALMDFSDPRSDLKAKIRKLKTLLPELPVVVLSDRAEMRSVLGAFEAGADAHMMKPAALAEMLQAVRTVTKGRKAMCARSQKLLPATLGGVDLRQAADEGIAKLLSHREEEILDLVGEGCQDKEIAEKLHLSVRTVNAHIRRILRKLDVRNRRKAARKYASMSSSRARPK